MAELQASSSYNRKFKEHTFDGMASAFRSHHSSCESYHVFINHRGPDVKMSLASVLYHYLQHLGLRVFLDTQELEMGNFLALNIQQAICTASVHIAIFSQNYASSPWCLDELALMLKTTAKIVPLFYNVQPSDLRHIEKGIYADAFVKYKEKGRYLDKLEEWRDALHKASLISGAVFKTDDDLGNLCKNTVDTVLKEIKRLQDGGRLRVAEYAVGLDESIEELERAISECGKNNGKGKIIGIVGAAGVGKTTLVQEFYNRKHSGFPRSSFLSDVRRAYANRTMASMQNKLLSDLSMLPSVSPFRPTIQNEGFGIDTLRSHFQCRCPEPFLIILDDIDQTDQLEELAVKEFLNHEGLVILTSTDASVLRSYGIFNIYKVKRLPRKQAKELFCWHAFRSPNPRNGFEQLVQDFLIVCDGLPFFLKLMGQHLFGVNDKNVWNAELCKISKLWLENIDVDL